MPLIVSPSTALMLGANAGDVIDAMKKSHEENMQDLWREFLGDEVSRSHCGLCGNSGMVDTRGKVFTAAGYECGVRTWCICPNGRALKLGTESEHELREFPKVPK